MKKYAFIFNPAAKSGRTDSLLRELKSRIDGKPSYDLFISQNPGGIAALINDLRQNYDVFVACGGDGTVRAVGAGIIGSNKILGVIPIGTGNDFSKSIRIPREISSAFEILESGSIQDIDVGLCNDFIFLNSLGFGFDGLTNRYALDYVKFPSFLRYLMAAIRATIHHKHFKAEISYPGLRENKTLIMFSLANGMVEGGNFWIAPHASITDGLLNLVTIKPIFRAAIPILLPLILFKKPEWIPYIESKEVKSLTVSFDNVPEIHADGEIIQSTEQEFNICVQPGSLKVIGGEKLI